MLLKSRGIRKLLFVLLSFVFIFVGVTVYLATCGISSEDPPLFTVAKKISKAIVMRGLDQVEIMSGSTYVSTPFDSHHFEYADLSHSYFEKIRNDKRVAHFYDNETATKQQKPIDFSDALLMKDYLRNLFPHGIESENFQNRNVLEMLDAAEQGEQFLCENISKMFVQLIQAGGTQARMVALEASHSGHVIVEMWSNHFNKWAVIDPDYSVYYTNARDIPLSAMELYVMSQDKERVDTIKQVRGHVLNKLNSRASELLELFYKNGFSILFYNRWVDKNLPRRNPARSPAIMGFYVGRLAVEKFYYKHGGDVLDKKIKTVAYDNPSKYLAVNKNMY